MQHRQRHQAPTAAERTREYQHVTEQTRIIGSWRIARVVTSASVTKPGQTITLLSLPHTTVTFVAHDGTGTNRVHADGRDSHSLSVVAVWLVSVYAHYLYL
jgi:hypothetical protein